MKILQEETLLEILGDKDFCVEVIEIYFKSVPELRTLSSSQLRDKDARLEDSFHTIKGNLSYFGAQPMVDCLQNAMESVRSGDWVAVQKHYGDLSGHFDILDQELEELKEKWKS